MQQIIDAGSWDAAMESINNSKEEEKEKEKEEEEKSSIPGVRKVKGISKLITKHEMTINNYRDVMSGFQTQRHMMNVIRSRDHVINIEQQEKTSLSILEDKRLVSLKAVMAKNRLICILFLIIENKKKKILIFLFFSFFSPPLLRFWINRFTSVAYGHPLCSKILALDEAKRAQGLLKPEYNGEYQVDEKGEIIDE